MIWMERQCRSAQKQQRLSEQTCWRGAPGSMWRAVKVSRVICVSLSGTCEQRGADEGTRTPNLRFTKPLLCQLSYIGQFMDDRGAHASPLRRQYSIGHARRQRACRWWNTAPIHPVSLYIALLTRHANRHIQKTQDGRVTRKHTCYHACGDGSCTWRKARGRCIVLTLS